MDKKSVARSRSLGLRLRQPHYLEQKGKETDRSLKDIHLQTVLSLLPEPPLPEST